ncbi:exonuclease V a 5' deoxyribonuclease-domain-containing protein [Mycena galopus ATCC 62051]|nr:exonuclease V a 5' deoxyribonuclease-domain-containing protein [Mycena galopus ATCC 62051]
MSEDSEYETYNDFAGLTEEDFALLDATAASSMSPSAGISGEPHHVASAMPSISIEMEDAYPSAEEGSPIRRYRHWSGILSVTDLISLAWCEVQFDYGLRQKRSKKLENRPPSFRSESGKEILVQQDVAVRNDKTTKRGQFIHKELELELRPDEEIPIVITTEEERWALRLINFLSSLGSLRAEGHAREIPVFGSSTDELLIKDKSEPTGTKRASDSSLPSPKRACRSPSPPSYEPEIIPAPLLPTPTPRCIRLIDTKTRRTDSLPSDEDAEPARLQLMLYHRLVTRLLDTSVLFDFSALWTLLGTCHSAPFTPTFLVQMATILGSDSVPTSLTALDLPPVDDTLQIIYRSQNKYSSKRSGAKGKRRERENTATCIPAAGEDDDELAKAIAMSLEGLEDVFEGQLAAALKESAALAGGVISETQSGNGRRSGIGAPRSEIIGTKEFTMHTEIIDAYLDNALDWWRGKRSARGVSDRQTGRC